jgi:hypothetical protein
MRQYANVISSFAMARSQLPTSELLPMSNKPKIDPRVRSKLDELGADVGRSKRGTFFAAVAAVVVGIAGIVLTLLY